MSEVNMRRAKASRAATVVDSSAEPPEWLAQKIVSAAKMLLPEGCIEPKYFNAAYADSLLEKVLFMLSATEEDLAVADGRDVLCAHEELHDNPGSTVIAGRSCYVLEPYPNPEGTFASLEAYEASLDVATRDLSLLLGCRVSWQVNGWHDSGQTYRILFQDTIHTSAPYWW